MLEKYKKHIIIGMLVLIPVGILEIYFIPEYKPNFDLPASIRQVVPSMEIPSSLASSGTVTNF